MREHPLRSLLSRLLRGPGNSSQIELVYRHRGAPDDQICIRFSTISRLGKGWFMLEDGDTQIPYHRVLYVRDLASGAPLWEKRQAGLALGRALCLSACLAFPARQPGRSVPPCPIQPPSHLSEYAE